MPEPGFCLDFSFLDIPVLDERNYPRNSRGVNEVAGLYAVGLPRPTGHASATLALVDEDARHVAGHNAARNPRQCSPWALSEPEPSRKTVQAAGLDSPG